MTLVPYSGEVYDIEVEEDHCFALACGMVAHNCEFCRAAARLFSEKPVALNQPFFPKGSTLAGVKGGVMALDYDDVNGPPLHPNDRCSVSAVLE